jgi:tellurite resistance protein
MSVPTSLSARIAPLLPAFKKDDLEILVDLVVLVAYADGVIDADEQEALRASLETIFHSPLSLMVVNTLIGSAIDEIKAAGGDAFASQIGKELGDHSRGEDGLRLAFTIAAVDGRVSDEERERLVLLGEGAGLSSARIAAIENEVVGS